MERLEEEFVQTQGDGQVDEACRECGKKFTAKVCKSNMLIGAYYKLNLVEHRILLACIAKLDSRKPIPHEIELTAGEYAEIFKTSLKRSYEALQRGSERLHERTLKVKGQEEAIYWQAGPVEYL